MDRQDDNIKPAITDLFTVIHELWYVSTITIHSAYHTFCTATFWYCLSDKGLESFNTGLKDRPRPLESYRTSIGEKEKKRKLEMLSRQKVELFISDYTKKSGSSCLRARHSNLLMIASLRSIHKYTVYFSSKI